MFQMSAIVARQREVKHIFIDMLKGNNYPKAILELISEKRK
jgi:hypothetical protein